MPTLDAEDLAELAVQYALITFGIALLIRRPGEVLVHTKRLVQDRPYDELG